MYQPFDFTNYIQQIYSYLEAQQRKIEQLELSIVELQEELNKVKEHSSPRVERIEYKFDQLKVERLEGTLNIGITPTGGIEPSSFEDFTVHRNQVNVPSIASKNPPFYEGVKAQVYNYLNSECFNVMKSLEEFYNYPLDAPYRNFIIDDIRKQIDKRIQYYLKDVNITDVSDDVLKQIEEKTFDNVKNDIHRTMEEFIKHLPKEGE